MSNDIRNGNIVVVNKIDRIALSLKGLIEIIELLNSKSVDLNSLNSGDKVDKFAELKQGMSHFCSKDKLVKYRKPIKFNKMNGLITIGITKT